MTPQLAPPPNVRDEAPFTPGRILRIARKYMVFVLACWLAVAGGVLFWSLGQRKVYRAETMLRLDPDPPRPLGQKVELVGGNHSYWNRREFFESEYKIMKSMRVAMATVRALGLNADPAFLDIKESKRAGFKPWAIDEAAVLLLQRLTIEPVKDSSLAVVRYEDTDPKRCELIVNTVTKVYLGQNLEATTAMSANAEQWLFGQLAHLKGDLEKSELALNDFRQKNNVLSLSLEDRHNLITAQLEQISKEQIVLEFKRNEVQSRHLELLEVNGDDPQKLGASEFLQSALLNVLRGAYAEQARNLEELSATLGESHPKVLAAKAKLDTTAKAIKAEVGNIKSAIAKDLRSLNRQLGDLKKKDDELQKTAHELQAFEVPFNQLNRTKTHNEKIYGLVLERARETELTRMMNFNNIRVIDEALTPRVPVRPNVPFNVVVASVLGLFLGLGLAVAREYADQSLRTPLDVEGLGVVCLGLLPEIERTRGRRGRKVHVKDLQARDLIVAQHPDGGVAEAARAIRTNLTFMSPDKPFHTILVTSAVPEEGKTTVACSIATVLAQSGHRVLLVDTDLRRPRLHRTFGIPNDLGVSMVVTQQATLDECTQDSPIANLKVLTAGPIPPNPAEMVQSERFNELMRTIASKYDRVVLDSPPLLPVTDAAVMSQLVDGVVVVTRAFRTQIGALRQALRTILDVKGRLIGVVLNAVDLGRSDYSGYHYYYHRRDGYYAREPGTEQSLT